MKKVFTASIAMLFGIVPLAASAHEHQSFEINGVVYDVVIGSLNEPIVVDDKTGVELRVSRVGGMMMGDDHAHDAGAPVTGLEEALQVELIAGDKRKTLSFSPTYNTPGAYHAAFYPTVATTLSYRVFGTIEGTPFDYTFTCNPAGHDIAPDDSSRVEISENVYRIHKSGAYGCPTEKAALGFPEDSADVVSLKSESGNGMVAGWGAGALALGALAVALTRRRS